MQTISSNKSDQKEPTDQIKSDQYNPKFTKILEQRRYRTNKPLIMILKIKLTNHNKFKQESIEKRVPPKTRP